MINNTTRAFEGRRQRPGRRRRLRMSAALAAGALVVVVCCSRTTTTTAPAALFVGATAAAAAFCPPAVVYKHDGRFGGRHEPERRRQRNKYATHSSCSPPATGAPSPVRLSAMSKKSTSNSIGNDSNDPNDDEAALAERIRRDRKFLERNQHWILFVDDEEAIRQSVGDFLYDSGYQVTACADAPAAVQVCRQIGADQTRPSCIVSDIRMPGGPSGLHLLQWIRAQDTLKRVPVVLLTAKGLTEDRIAGYKAGADVYLPKPFYPDELLSVVDNLIARRQEMVGQSGSLVDLQQEMANIKLLLQENGRTTVKKTDVYLTPAQREVLELLCQGYTNAEIAEERKTTKAYVTKTLQTIYRETGTSTRTELLKWAVQTGYVSPNL